MTGSSNPARPRTDALTLMALDLWREFLVGHMHTPVPSRLQVEDALSHLVTKHLEPLVLEESVFKHSRVPGGFAADLRCILHNIKDGNLSVETPERIQGHLRPIVRGIILWARDNC